MSSVFIGLKALVLIGLWLLSDAPEDSPDDSEDFAQFKSCCCRTFCFVSLACGAESVHSRNKFSTLVYNRSNCRCCICVHSPMQACIPNCSF